MQCPTCLITLQIADRQGIEVDYCPKCRGIWLDRGELEKLLERSVDPWRGSPRSYSDDGAPFENSYRDRDDRDRHHGQVKRRESWLGRLLDFD